MNPTKYTTNRVELTIQRSEKPTKMFVRGLRRYYQKVVTTPYMYKDEQEIATEILRFLKKNQTRYGYLIEYEYPIFPAQINKGIGDIRVTFDNAIFVIELKLIHSNRSYGTGKTERTSRNKKRNKVIQQATYYAKATKKDCPDKSVIPISITDEKFSVHDEITKQYTYPWDKTTGNRTKHTNNRICIDEFPPLACSFTK